MSRAVLICVRTLVERTDTFGGAWTEPQWPAAVVSQHREDNGWWSLRTSGGALLHARAIVKSVAGDRLVCAVYGPRALIVQLAAASDRAWTLAELQADTTALAMRIKNAMQQARPATIAGENDDEAKDDGT